MYRSVAQNLGVAVNSRGSSQGIKESIVITRRNQMIAGRKQWKH